MKKNSRIQIAVATRKIFLAITVLLTTGLISSGTFAAVPDFSGKWILDEEQSEIGETRFRPSMTLEVNQDKNQLTVIRVRKGRDGSERRMESVYSLEGKETTDKTENRSTISSAKWSDDGTSLVIRSKSSFSREGQTFEFETEETWKLEKGGKVLNIQSKISSSRGESSRKLVYNLDT